MAQCVRWLSPHECSRFFQSSCNPICRFQLPSTFCSPTSVHPKNCCLRRQCCQPCHEPNDILGSRLRSKLVKRLRKFAWSTVEPKKQVLCIWEHIHITFVFRLTRQFSAHFSITRSHIKGLDTIRPVETTPRQDTNRSCTKKRFLVRLNSHVFRSFSSTENICFSQPACSDNVLLPA